MSFRWVPTALILSLGVVLGFFQNCTSSVPFGTVDYYSKLTSSTTFPYEVGFDQVAYISCSEQEDVYGNSGGNPFFTFRVGAYRSQGLRISSQYRDQVEKVNDENVVNALQESPNSSATQIQLSIRTSKNLQSIYANKDHGEGKEGSDYSHFFPTMGEPDLSHILWFMKPGEYLRNYMGGRDIDQYRFEGELKFMSSEKMERDLRFGFSDELVLTLGFAKVGDANDLLGPGSFLASQDPESGERTPSQDGINDLHQNVFGMAVRPRFKQPTIWQGDDPRGSPGRYMPPRVLASIREYAVDGRKKPADIKTWQCPKEMQFMIVLPEDAVRVGCRTKPDDAEPDDELRIIRQSLYSEDWWIDKKNHCIVPKGGLLEGSCYGRDEHTKKTHKINYRGFINKGFSKKCGFPYQYQEDLYDRQIGLCPHYASICLRDIEPPPQ